MFPLLEDPVPAASQKTSWHWSGNSCHKAQAPLFTIKAPGTSILPESQGAASGDGLTDVTHCSGSAPCSQSGPQNKATPSPPPRPSSVPYPLTFASAMSRLTLSLIPCQSKTYLLFQNLVKNHPAWNPQQSPDTQCQLGPLTLPRISAKGLELRVCSPFGEGHSKVQPGPA